VTTNVRSLVMWLGQPCTSNLAPVALAELGPAGVQYGTLKHRRRDQHRRVQRCGPDLQLVPHTSGQVVARLRCTDQIHSLPSDGRSVDAARHGVSVARINLDVAQTRWQRDTLHWPEELSPRRSPNRRFGAQGCAARPPRSRHKSGRAVVRARCTDPILQIQMRRLSRRCGARGNGTPTRDSNVGEAARKCWHRTAQMSHKPQSSRHCAVPGYERCPQLPRRM